MIPVTVQTLVMSPAPAPSILVLQPVEPSTREGVSRIVPIWVGFTESLHIGFALEARKTVRPMTHDLFLDALTNMDARIDHAIITEVQGSAFFAHLYLRQYGRLIGLDARPSDAISLALRQQAPLYVSEEVLENASLPFIVRTAMSTSPVTDTQLSDSARIKQELSDFHDFLEGISPEDFSE